MKRFAVLLRVAVYGLAVFLAFSLYAFFLYSRPSRYISKTDPGDFGLVFEDIAIRTDDGQTLAGWFIPNRNSSKAIVVCHGYPMDKGNVLDIVSGLAAENNLLLFDFRAMGRSTGMFSSGGWRERRDLLAAVRYLRVRGFEKIGAIGFSMGAAVILMSESRDLSCMVCDSSYARLEPVIASLFRKFGFLQKPFTWSMNLWTVLFTATDINKVAPVRFIGEIKAPLLLIHCQGDREIPVEHAKTLYAASGDNCTLWLVPGGDHILAYMARQEEYREKTAQFFREHL